MMTAKVSNSTVGKEKSKVVSIAILYSLSVALIISGVFFSIYSFMTNTSFRVLNTDVSGVIFGAAVIYFGIRNFLSVNRLKKDLYQSSSKFSWGNFRGVFKKEKSKF